MEAHLALSEHPSGLEVGSGNHVAYDLEGDVAHFGAVRLDGPALLWELTATETNRGCRVNTGDFSLARAISLDGAHEWLIRCDRVDFPRGAVADWHFHPGPGIRRLLFGELTVTTGGVTNTHRVGDPWFESGPEPVYAASSTSRESAFVRVMVLPAEWAGRRTIRYIDPAATNRTARQRARVLIEESIVD